MKLKWLEIERFRTVKPGTRLVFDDGINVLLGKNGTGKTTLLELISALVRGDVSAYDSEPFELRFEVEKAGACLVFGFENREVDETELYDWALVVDVEVDKASARLVANPYGAKVTLDGAEVPVRVWSPMDGSLLAAPFMMMGVAPEFSPALHDALSGFVNTTHSRRFDEALGIFDAHFGSNGVADRDFWVAAIVGEDGMVTDTHRASDDAIPPSAVWGLDGILVRSRDERSWLTRVAELLDVEDVAMYLRRTAVKPRKAGRVVEFGQVDFEFSFADGRLITQRQLSYGQKRLLAFLFYLARVRGPVVADEIVNGMHHAWVEACMEMIREKGLQAFLTSQNPLLLDELEFDDAEAVQRTFIIAEVEDGQFRWRQLDEGEARRFFTAYETGIQHVGEVLLTEGLW